MRKAIAAIAVLGCVSLVRADDASVVLARADQAFASADYKTAVALYQKIDPQLTADQQSAVAEKLRFASKQMAQTPVAATPPVVVASAVTPSPESAPATTQPAERVKHVRPADGKTLSITLHELGNFDYNEDDDKSIPADVRALDGVHVKIPGFMLPLDQSGHVTRFIIVNDMMSCCYGTAPTLQHVAYVELPKDKWMAATTDRITIEGTLKVNVRRDDGFVLSIFEIQPTSVKLAGE